MIKKKHKTTNSLLIDILKLLTLLKVPKVPVSWHQLKQTISKSDEKQIQKQKMIDLTLYFCPECEEQSNDRNRCTNTSCSYNMNVLVPPHTCMIMNIQQQIEQILKSIHENDLHLSTKRYRKSTTSMTDIQDGRVYKEIICSLKNGPQIDFITLTCNMDGVAVYTSSEQSMWTFTACINELKRTTRFSIENIIGKKSITIYSFSFFSLCIQVLAVSVGRKKPSRSIMQKILSPIVSRLKQLQNINLYKIAGDSYEMLRVYVIGICNDKPANSLVQNQSEPNAMHGCSRCEIAG
jgi:hypothetical protein